MQRNVLNSTNTKREDCSVDAAIAYVLDDPGFTIGRNTYISLCHQRYYQIYKPTVYRKSDHSFKSGAQIKITWRYTPICIPTRPYVFIK